MYINAIKKKMTDKNKRIVCRMMALLYNRLLLLKLTSTECNCQLCITHTNLSKRQNPIHQFTLSLEHSNVVTFFRSFHHYLIIIFLFGFIWIIDFLISEMDKLKRVLSGNDETTNDENRGIMGDVGV